MLSYIIPKVEYPDNLQSSPLLNNSWQSSILESLQPLLMAYLFGRYFSVQSLLNLSFLLSAIGAILKDLVVVRHFVVLCLCSCRDPARLGLHVAFFIESLNPPLVAEGTFKFFLSFPSKASHHITYYKVKSPFKSFSCFSKISFPISYSG